MEYNFSLENSKDYLNIKRNDKNYKVDIFFSCYRFENYFKKFNETNDYKKAFNELYTVEDDCFVPNDIEKELILKQIIQNNNLEKIFNKIDENDIYIKLYKTLDSYQKELSRKTKAILEPLLNFNIKMQKMLDTTLSPLIEKINALQQSISFKLEKVLPKISDKKYVNEVKKKFEKWGKFGWVILPDISIDFFIEMPSTQKEADKKYLSQIDKELVKDVKSYIYKKIKHRKKYCEAIKCYDSKYYLASAMILVSLIERVLTELPMKSKYEEKARNKQIIKNYKEHIIIDDKNLIDVCYLTNLTSFLFKLFENGNDFKRQRFNVNRNFIMHGWRDINTSQTDCIKLLFALYSILYMWDDD